MNNQNIWQGKSDGRWNYYSRLTSLVPWFLIKRKKDSIVISYIQQKGYDFYVPIYVKKWSRWGEEEVVYKKHLGINDREYPTNPKREISHLERNHGPLKQCPKKEAFSFKTDSSSLKILSMLLQKFPRLCSFHMH